MITILQNITVRQVLRYLRDFKTNLSVNAVSCKLNINKICVTKDLPKFITSKTFTVFSVEAVQSSVPVLLAAICVI